MPSHYNEEEKKRSRLPGLKPGQELTTAGPGIEAIKGAVKKTGETLFGGIAPEKRGGYRGYETGGAAGTGFMESGIPIPPSQAGVMQPMPTRPAVGGTMAPIVTLPDGIGGSRTGGAMPTSPVDLAPRLAEIEAGVEGGIPSAFDTEKAHRLGMERYGEGQTYLPPGQRSVYGDAIDSVLGPSPTVQPTQQGIPSEIAGPGSSGNAMVDLFRWVAHNKRLQQQNKLLGEQQQRTLESEKYAGEQEFKERKLASEEKGRKDTLKLGRRKAIATEAKKAEKLDPFMKRAEDLIKDTDEYKYETDPEKKRTMLLTAAENVEKRHKRSPQESKPKFKEGDEKIINGVTYKVVDGKVVKS